LSVCSRKAVSGRTFTTTNSPRSKRFSHSWYQHEAALSPGRRPQESEWPWERDGSCPLRWYPLVSQSGAHSACKRQHHTRRTRSTTILLAPAARPQRTRSILRAPALWARMREEDIPPLICLMLHTAEW